MRSLVPDRLEDRLNAVQLKLQSKDIPVLIIFEGGSGRVISRVINEVNRTLEPRGIDYRHFDPREYDGIEGFAAVLEGTPAKGDIALYDRSWYSHVVDEYDGDPEKLRESARDIADFERYLTDNGTFLIKIRLNVDTESLCRYADDYRPTTVMNGTYLSVDRVDRVKYWAVMPELVGLTDTEGCPWDTVTVSDVGKTVSDVCGIIADRMEEVSEKGLPTPRKAPGQPERENPRKGLAMKKKPKNHSDRMEALSDELGELQILLAMSGRSLVCAFEGWDAAGKGGCIKHLSHGLNPRGYRVARIGVPSEEDLAHTYLWRFARHLPRPGHIAIFDRSWYGRMMVEPIEGFCSEEEYSRSAGEINMFERILRREGAIVIKFWLDIDSDEQLKRFNDRRDDPLKSWKLTDEDWRNREKRQIYEEYADRMIGSTNTPWAPWVAVPANNKKAAQLCVLSTVVETLKKEIYDDDVD